jgi:hypothetical protein
MQSIPLKQYTSPLESINSINDAHTEFKRVYKKGAKISLAYSERGSLKLPEYWVAVWTEGDTSQEELTWFRNYFSV